MKPDENSHKTTSAADQDVITCLLCAGKGTLSRSEVLEKLGAKDLGNIAEMGAEKALRQILEREELKELKRREWYAQQLGRQREEDDKRHRGEIDQLRDKHQLALLEIKKLQDRMPEATQAAADQARREVEDRRLEEVTTLNARIQELSAKLGIAERERDVAANEASQSATDDTRQVFEKRVEEQKEAILTLKSQLNQAAKDKDLALREAVQKLEEQLATERRRGTETSARLQEREKELVELRGKLDKVSATKGRVEELSFEDEAARWPEIELSEKQARDGDFLLWLRMRDPNGNLVRARNPFVIDNKDAKASTKHVEDLEKAVQKRRAAMGILLYRDESLLRSDNGAGRWCHGPTGTWILHTTRACFRRDLEVLRPVLDRLAQEGPDFLQRESALASGVAGTLKDLDGVLKHVTRARESLEAIEGLCATHKKRLTELCQEAMGQDKPADDAA